MVRAAPDPPPPDRPRPPPRITHAPDRVLVKFAEGVERDGLEERTAMLAVRGEIRQRFRTIPWCVVHVPMNEADSARELLSLWPGVEMATLDHAFTFAAVPNDHAFPQQWSLQNTGQTVNGIAGIPGADIRAVPAWGIRTDGSSVIVAVIDSGVNYLHPDLAANMWTNYAELNGMADNDDDYNGWMDDVHGTAEDNLWDPPGSGAFCADPFGQCPSIAWWDPGFLLCDVDSYDIEGRGGQPNSRLRSSVDGGGHGTTVAAVIGGVGNNGYPDPPRESMCGVAWGARIMSIRVANRCIPGFGLESNIVDAMEYAMVNGARIVNMSLEGPASDTLYEACKIANGNDLLMIVAAGNTGSTGRNIDLSPTYPASWSLAFPNMIVVAASDQADNRGSFSNWGPNSVHLAAPGTNIRTLGTTHDLAFGGDCVLYQEGTSFSAPLVSGAAALVWAQHPGWTGQMVKDQILAHVRTYVNPNSTLNGKTATNGILDVHAALLP